MRASARLDLVEESRSREGSARLTSLVHAGARASLGLCEKYTLCELRPSRGGERGRLGTGERARRICAVCEGGSWGGVGSRGRVYCWQRAREGKGRHCSRGERARLNDAPA